MTDREKYLTILDRFYRGRGGSLLTKDESEALDYAISSIKTDLKYDLLYEETKHIANVSKMIEPTTKNCRSCRNFGSHHGICEICKDNKCWTEITKNDLGVDWESCKDANGNSLDDLILEVLQNNFDCGNTYGYKVADEIIGLLPSVTPQEPKTGHWIECMPGGAEEWCYKCSECNFWKYKKTINLSKFKFCPNCGAKMEEVEE